MLRSNLESILNKSQDSGSSSLKNVWPVGRGRLAIVTCGDDAQGMNACVRAVYRMGRYLGATVMVIKHGLKGLVDGGPNNIMEATWRLTSNIIGDGGTVLKSFMCPGFRDRAVRLQAAKNLILNEIIALVAIGGGGTIHAMSIFKQEWVSLLRELDDKKLVDRELLQFCQRLSVVVVPSGIENDVIGTDKTIGFTSALHRIVEATDAIATTSSSTQQAFVIEVMGQDSGYLALCAGLACDACMIFLPEWPINGDWKDELVKEAKTYLGDKESYSGLIVITCQGAVDKENNTIMSEEIRDVLSDRLRLNVTLTVLGHVQKGGSPCAYDRLLASRLGAEAVVMLKDLKEEPLILGIHGYEIICMPLYQSLENLTLIKELMKERMFEDVVPLRGNIFQTLLSAYRTIHELRTAPLASLGSSSSKNVGILRVGKSTVGQCSVTKNLVTFCQNKGLHCLGIDNGYEGLANQKAYVLSQQKIKDWTYKTNVCLGSTKMTLEDIGIGRIAAGIEALKLSALVILGDFPAFHGLYKIEKAKYTYRSLCIPMCVIPVSVFNNIPGTNETIGTDTALNVIVEYCDKIKRIAHSQKNYVYVVETLGHNVGYLATISGICTGAEAAYIKQMSMSLDRLLKDASTLREKIANSDTSIGLILRSEFANDNYNTEFVYHIYAEEGKGVYSCLHSVIGPIQIGAVPSPLDRLQSTLQGLRCGLWLKNAIDTYSQSDGDVYTEDPHSKVVLCINKRSLEFIPVTNLSEETNWNDRTPKNMWWLNLITLLRILTYHFEEDYVPETVGSCAASEKDN